ncbi:hypothetical protein ABT158_47235, partial [Nonomuraea sp. NPDC001636]
MTAARWLTRDDLASAARTAEGLLLVAPDLSSVFPLAPEDAAAATGLTAAALRAAGVGGRDRVVVALAEPAGALSRRAVRERVVWLAGDDEDFMRAIGRAAIA